MGHCSKLGGAKAVQPPTMRKFIPLSACQSMLLPRMPNGSTNTFSSGAKYRAEIPDLKNTGVSSAVVQKLAERLGTVTATSDAAMAIFIAAPRRLVANHIEVIIASSRNT